MRSCSAVSHDTSNIAKPKPTSANSGTTTHSGGPSAKIAIAGGQIVPHAIANRIG